MNWKSPNAFARATMANPLGMPPAQTRGRVQAPLGISLGDPARPVIPARALVPGPGSARPTPSAGAPTVAAGAKVFRTPCPPGWEQGGETPWGGKICWPKPGTAVVGRR